MKKFINNVKNTFMSVFGYQSGKNYNFTIPEKNNENLSSESSNNSNVNSEFSQIDYISPSISTNLKNIQIKYNSLINSDIIIREFDLIARGQQYHAFILYIDGMSDTDLINHFVLEPLMVRNRANMFNSDSDKVESNPLTNNVSIKKVKKFDLLDSVYTSLMPQNSVKKVTGLSSVISGVNSGNCALFIDTINVVLDIDVKGFKQRSIDKPNNEIVIRGSQEAFIENLRTNTSLLRRLINNENLVIENVEVGKLSKTKCAICYMKNIANSDLVNEVKYRINNLDIDYLISSGQLEQLIEDNGKVTLPQLIATERPDKASNYLFEGRVVIIVNGGPYCLIAPGTLIDFLSSPEDLNLKYQFANLLKVIRIIGLVITLLLPGLYIAVTNYHQELLPTELLFAIVASRSSVPFPIIFEIIVMELSFELIREASLRVPSPIGPTIGIIGALILGQAAVDANIVSPILIIIVSLTAISSFSIPDFALGFHCRILRFIYIVFGYLLGFLGISIVLFVHLLVLCNLKSFGAPYLQPYLPNTKDYKGIFLSPAWKREHRADFLNTKRDKKQDNISMKWKN